MILDSRWSFRTRVERPTRPWPRDPRGPGILEWRPEPDERVPHAGGVLPRRLDPHVQVQGPFRQLAQDQQALDETHAAIEAAGFRRMVEFNRPTADASVEFIIGPHAVGDWGHGSGPSLAFFNPKQLTFDLKPTNFISIELFAYTPIPEWNGRKLRIPLEDDAVVTERGVEWLYPVADRIRVIR